MPHYKLSYFGIRGRVEPTRFIFAYAGVPYEDVRIAFEDWPKLKSTFPLGQMPVLEVDGKTIVQSKAIARYLARQFGLCGKCDFEAALCDGIVDGLDDVTTFDYLMERDPVKKVLSFTDVTLYEKFLADNGTGYFVGNQLTWADISVFHIVQLHGLSDGYPKLHAFMKKIGETPKIKAWIDKRPKTDA